MRERSGACARLFVFGRIDGDAAFLHQDFDVLEAVDRFAPLPHADGEFCADRTHRRTAGFDIERTRLVVRHLEQRFAALEHDVAQLLRELHADGAVRVQVDDAAVVQNDSGEAAEVGGVFVPARTVVRVPE